MAAMGWLRLLDECSYRFASMSTRRLGHWSMVGWPDTVVMRGYGVLCVYQTLFLGTLDRASLCSQNRLYSLWHGLHKMLLSFEILLHGDMSTPHNFCRFVSFTFILWMSCSTTPQRCSTGFRCGRTWHSQNECETRGGPWYTWSSLSCSWNQFVTTFSLWQGALSCWK